MNERIRELIEECTDRHFSECVGGFETFDKEKFAELIVRECANVVTKRKDQAIDDNWNVDEAMSMAEMDLLEHFGVTE
jgi:hypothetical protein